VKKRLCVLKKFQNTHTAKSKMLQIGGGPHEATNTPATSPWAHWLSTWLNLESVCSQFTHALPIESPSGSDKSRFRQIRDKMSLKPSQMSHSRLNESVPCRQRLLWWSWLPWTGQMSGKSCSCVMWKFSLSFFHQNQATQGDKRTERTTKRS